MTEQPEALLRGGFHCRSKPMPNGEVRTSMASPDETKICITDAPLWKVDEALPWQSAHFHKGLTETYQLVSGWMRLIWLQGSVFQAYLSEPGQVRVLPPGVPHNVLLGPGARIITTSFGTRVPNPNKKENDWWDVEPEFHGRIANELRLIEEMVIRSF